MEKRLRDEIDWLIERAVALARREGFDWGRISRLLGITRQWARERLNSGAGHPPDDDDDVVAW